MRERCTSALAWVQFYQRHRNEFTDRRDTLCFYHASAISTSNRIVNKWRWITNKRRKRWPVVTARALNMPCMLGSIAYKYVVIITTTYGIASVQLTHSSWGDRENIFVTYLIVIIKSPVSTFPIIVIFPVIMCLWLSGHHILSVASYKCQESWVFLSITLCSLWCVQIIG